MKLPAGWIDANNELYPVPTVEVLNALALAIATAFQQRFFETATLRTSIMEATNEAELDLVECPYYSYG